MDRVSILGCYPVVDEARFESSGVRRSAQPKPSVSIQHLTSFMKDVRLFLAKKAKELVALNISDLSGNPSKTPHTILGATYLTYASLKVVGRQCINDVCQMLEKKGAKVLNIGVDGESLQMASILPDGTPGTMQTLVKHLHDKLKGIKKEKLYDLALTNPNIDLSAEAPTDEFEDENLNVLENLGKNEEEIIDDIMDCAALIEYEADGNYTLEDVEEMLSDNIVNATTERKEILRGIKLVQLRIICLRYILPKAKRIWLSSALGVENIEINLADGETLVYTPNSIFEKMQNYFRTVSFDYAHIINLFREHAAKGQLLKMGLDVKNLETLSTTAGFEHLKRIIATKGNKLVFDSMNQKAAASLFSVKTEKGLKAIGDMQGAKFVKVLSDGLAALDESGISTANRIRRIVALKTFLEEKNDVVERLKRPDNHNISNELLQMILTTLDSFIYTAMNMEFFNVRRKGEFISNYVYVINILYVF